MSPTVCLGANTHALPRAGGHLWAYLNWALGLRRCGCRVLWLEQVDGTRSPHDLCALVAGLRERLAPFGLEQALALCTNSGAPLPDSVHCPGLEDVASRSDLLLDIGNKIAPVNVARFRRTALVDIDPGLLQSWVAAGKVPLPEHDAYFTIGETVGARSAPFPDCGVPWQHTPPAVDLKEWAPVPGSAEGPYTTVSSWWGWWDEADGVLFDNQKRVSFLEFRDLPRAARVRFELALGLWGADDEADVEPLRRSGWTVQNAFEVARTPEDYRRFVRGSRAEWSCAKPSCLRFANAWISDRTLCYLASGRPAVVQHTGPSRYLPDAAGLVRFEGCDGAVRAIEAVELRYDFHAREARALAEEHFDAHKVAARVLERALP